MGELAISQPHWLHWHTNTASLSFPSPFSPSPCGQIQTTVTHTTTGDREVKITAWKNALWLVWPSPITTCSQSYISLSYKTLTPSARQAQELVLKYECSRCESERIVIPVVQNGQLYIQVIVAVLLYGALMRRKVAAERDRAHC